MTQLIDDVSKLTDVSEATLRKLVNVGKYCIGHAVYEDLCEHIDITTIDLGFGELSIKVDNDSIRYRFTPSTKLETLILQAVKQKASPIMIKIEDGLQDKIDKMYEELL